jgi:WW domain-containing oxidoreductase
VGYATAEALLRQGTNVVLACRSGERAAAAAAQLAALTAAPGSSSSGNNSSSRSNSNGSLPCGTVEVELLDLASLSSVREFVQRWRRSRRQLDLLICNAGIMCPPQRTETPDGFELQFQVGPGGVVWCGGGMMGRAGLWKLPLQAQSTRHLPAAERAAAQDHQAATSAAPSRLASPPCPAPAPQSNYLAHFQLTNALVRHHREQQQGQRRRQRRGGKEGQAQQRPLRVLLLSSMTHFGGDLSDLSEVLYCRRQPFNTFQAYANSKLCTLLAAKHLDRLFIRYRGLMGWLAEVLGGSGGGGSMRRTS